MTAGRLFLESCQGAGSHLSLSLLTLCLQGSARQQRLHQVLPQVQRSTGSACTVNLCHTLRALPPSQVPLNLTEGPWQLILRNDVFSKVRGSVVLPQELSNAAYYLRHYVALASVVAEMDFEEQLLQVRRRCTWPRQRVGRKWAGREFEHPPSPDLQAVPRQTGEEKQYC